MTDVRGPEPVVRFRQVQNVHDAQQIRECVGQEVRIGRLSSLARYPIPAAADRLIEALIEHGEPGDHRTGGGDQQRDADLMTVPRQVPRQQLALQRVIDGLVTPLDLAPFQVDEHVGQAGDGSHEKRRQPADGPQARQPPAEHPAHDEETEDDRQKLRPRGPREQTLPEQESVPDPPLNARPNGPHEPARQADPEENPGGRRQPRQRRQEQVRRMDLIRIDEPGREMLITVAPSEAPQRLRALSTPRPAFSKGPGGLIASLAFWTPLSMFSPACSAGPLGSQPAQVTDRPEQQCGEQRCPIHSVLAHPNTSKK